MNFNEKSDIFLQEVTITLPTISSKKVLSCILIYLQRIVHELQFLNNKGVLIKQI